MKKRNPVVRDLIQRPPRGAGKHKDRRKKVDKKFDKEALRGLFCTHWELLGIPLGTDWEPTGFVTSTSTGEKSPVKSRLHRKETETMSDATKKPRKTKAITPTQAAKIEGAFEAAMAAKRQQEMIEAFGGTAVPTTPQKFNGRPSKYSAAIAQEICEGLAEGIPLREICRRDHMPEWRTVYDWMRRDEALSTSIAHARDIGYDKMAEECLAIADTPVEGRKIVETDDGKVMYTREDMLGHRKLQIETRLKLLAKFNPKKYGDRAILAGDAENPLQINVQAVEMFESILKNAEMTRQIEE